MFWARAALFVLLSAVPAFAQTNPGFVTGAILCANTTDPVCQNNTPQNPSGLNQAFVTKMDANRLSLPNTWLGLQTFSGGAIVPTLPFGDNTTNAASTAFVQAAKAAPLFPTNASGKDTTATGSISAGSSVINLTAPSDFIAGQGVWVPQAGPSPITATPVLTAVTVNSSVANFVTFSGTPTAGETVQIQFGAPVTQTLSYTMTAADNLETIAYQFQQAAYNVNNFGPGNGVYVTWDVYPIQNFTRIRVEQISTAPALTLTLTSSAHVTLSQTGFQGASTSVTYKIMSRDNFGGVSAPTAGTTVTNSGNPALPPNRTGALGYNRNPAAGSTNTVHWTNDGNAIDIVVCRNNQIVAVVPASDGTWRDEGQLPFTSPDLPACTTGISTPGPLVAAATIVTPTQITLNTTAGNAVLASANNVHHDDGVALQAMLTAGCGADVNMLIPIGTYNTHQALTCFSTGGNFGGTFLRGQGGTNRIGPRLGSFISYWGRSDEAVLTASGLNGATISDLVLYGNYIAHAAYAMNYSNGGQSGDQYNRVGFWRPNTGNSSAIIQLGDNSCLTQLSEQFFWQVYMFQDVGTQYGAFIPCGGNQKNIHFTDYSLLGVHTGFFGTPSSGNWSFINGVTDSIADWIFSGTPTLMVNALEAENYVNSGLVTTANSATWGFISLNAVQFLTPEPSSGFQVANTTNIAVTLTNSAFGGGNNMGEFRWGGSFTAPGVTFFSVNNFFENSTSWPAYIGNTRYGGPNNFPSDSGRIVTPIGLVSIGDYGAPLVSNGGAGVQYNITRFGQSNLMGGQYIADQSYVRQWISNAAAVPTNYLEAYGSGLRSRAWTTPAAPTVTRNTTGAATCTYQVAFRDATGQHTTPLGAQTTHADCAVTPNNTITTTVQPGVFYMDVYDTVATMLVGTVCAIPAAGCINTTQPLGAVWSLIDNNNTRTAYSPPATFNNTGQLQADGGLISTPTTVGALPACGAALQGATFFVTDQNTAIAYHGAVTGGGANKQAVTCDGSAYYQK